MEHWFQIHDTDQLLTPALLFYPDRIERNIDQMIRIAGSAGRLRPHVKTYKCREIVNLQMARGITKFKCATLAEAVMLAQSGAKDILVAYPLIGPACRQFIKLIENYPGSKFSALVEHDAQLKTWNSSHHPINLFIDLDVGMHRTGISMEKAEGLLQELKQGPHRFSGWHLYDGHIHHTDLQERTEATEIAYKDLKKLIERTGTSQQEIICGSSVTFAIHAKHAERQLSPGTTLLWDQGYSTNFPDLKFNIAASIMTRIISKPNEGLLCLDLGYKALASEMSGSPVYFPQIPDAEIVVHSEEHLVIESGKSQRWKIGDVVYGFPWHICPTVALHAQAGIIKNHNLTGLWNIDARNRIYTYE